MNKILLCAGLSLIARSAYAEPVANFYVPIPNDVTGWVTAHTGTKISNDEKFGVLDNDTPLFIVKITEGISGVSDAAYSEGHIYLSVRAAVHSQEDKYKALLIHELVHKSQDLNGKHYICDGAREAEAYRLQNEYLMEKDLPLAIDADTLIRLQNCDNAMGAALMSQSSTVLATD